MNNTDLTKKDRHCCWAEALSQFNLSIQYRPGVENTAADCLCRYNKSHEKRRGSTKPTSDLWAGKRILPQKLMLPHQEAILTLIASLDRLVALVIRAAYCEPETFVLTSHMVLGKAIGRAHGPSAVLRNNPSTPKLPLTSLPVLPSSPFSLLGGSIS
jgi:hypothetical protein